MASVRLDRLLAVLNNSGIQIQNNALYQVIKSLIDETRKIENALASASSGGNTSITNIQQIYQILGGDSSDGDGQIGPPGIRGDRGADGATGAQGPPFPAFIVYDPDIPEDPLVIPGPQGIQGPMGATGPTSPVAIITNEEQYEESIFQQISAGTGSSWQLIEARAMTGQSQEDFINLSSYTELLLICSGITKSVSTTLQLRASTDNGATFLSTSGDYVSIPAAGTTSNLTAIIIHGTSATAARSGTMLISGFNITGTPKVVQAYNNALNNLVTTTTALNAIRVMPTSAATLNAGTIYLLGR